jgi:ureidoacrylate peracid hydrolase
MAARSVQVEARPFAVDLDPQETAVIVVDMQWGFFGTGGAWNRAGVDVSNAQATIAPIARVLAAAREVGMPIIYATMDLDGPAPAGAAPGYWTEERLSRWVAAGEPRQPMSHAGQLPPGVKESDILPELAPQPDEVIIVKPRFSAFYNTDLDAILKELGVTTLVFTGGTTSICVESTLRDAFFRDYRCLLLADCTAEPIGNRLPRTNREATLLLVELVYGWVAESAALVRTLGEQSVAVHVAQAV